MTESYIAGKMKNSAAQALPGCWISAFFAVRGSFPADTVLTMWGCGVSFKTVKDSYGYDDIARIFSG